MIKVTYIVNYNLYIANVKKLYKNCKELRILHITNINACVLLIPEKI